MREKMIFSIIFGLLYASASLASGADTKYVSVDVKNGGTVSGTVTFKGQVPKVTQIKVSKDTKVCGKHKMDESLLVDPATKGMKNAVVYLKNIQSGKSWQIDENSLAMDQKGCQFTPHVLLVPVGQTFYMLNNDGILHNIHTRSEINKEINKAQPKFLKKMKLSFEKPEFVKVTCDVHNWMTGWIVVAPHPYYVVTDANGKFQIKNVPPGTYELEVWHEKLGAVQKQVEVKAGETATLEVSLK